MDLTHYSEMKAKGKVVLGKKVNPKTQEIIYTLTFGRYDERTGEKIEDVVKELTPGKMAKARERLTRERAALLAKREVIDELISDAQAL